MRDDRSAYPLLINGKTGLGLSAVAGPAQQSGRSLELADRANDPEFVARRWREFP